MPSLRTHDAVDDIERIGAGLHELRRVVKRLRAQFARGEPRGFAAHHGDARGKSAHAARDPVGLAVDHAHAGVIDAKRIGANLRDHGFDALADARRRR